MNHSDVKNKIQQLWSRLEVWANANAPQILKLLNPPATEAEIVRIAEKTGLTPPQSLIELLWIHNGENATYEQGIFPEALYLMSTTEMINFWEMEKSIAPQLPPNEPPERIRQLIQDGIIFVEGPVKPDYSNAKRLPFANFDGNIIWYIDFDPDEGGTVGQVIETDPEGCIWKVLAPSFLAFFETYVADLEAGIYRINQDGYLISSDSTTF